MPTGTPPSEIARRAAIELVLPGYPAEPFDSEEEIEATLVGDRIPCMMCGKEYAALVRHVIQTHQMSEAEYRLTFNIPTKFPLTGAAFRKRRQEVATRQDHVEKIRLQKPRTVRTREMCELAARHRSEKIWAARRSAG